MNSSSHNSGAGLAQTLSTPKKVKELAESLSKDKGNSDKTKTEILSSELALSLFSQAPSDFLSGKSLDDLVKLTHFCEGALTSFALSPTAPAIQLLQEKETTYLCVVLNDRPFIINSLVLALDRLSLASQLFLHPILTLKNGRRASLSLLELDAVSEAQTELLKRYLAETLANVISVTDDFPSMLAQVQAGLRLLEQIPSVQGFANAERKEVADFLRWISDSGFVFFGVSQWEVSSGELSEKTLLELGLFRSIDRQRAELSEEVQSDLAALLESSNLLSYSKLTLVSPIHRKERLDHIAVRQFSSDGALTGVLSIVGLFTFHALRQTTSEIPLIRQKLQRLIEIDNLVPNSFDYKAVFNVLDGMPREMIFAFDIDEIRENIHLVTNLHRGSDTVARVRLDKSGRGLSVVVMMGYDHFNERIKDRIQNYLEDIFGISPGSSEYRLAQTARPVAVMYFHIALKDAEIRSLATEKIEQDLIILTQSWRLKLREVISRSDAFQSHEDVWLRYRDAFSESYQAANDIDRCLNDILHLEQVSPKNPLAIGINPGKESHTFELTLYSLTEITLSQTLPILENIGLLVVKEDSSPVTQASSQKFIHRFSVKPKDKTFVGIETLGHNFSYGLVQIFTGKVENDPLNSLLLQADLDTQSISLLRAFCQYMWQITKFASRGVIMSTLASTPNAAALLWNMFEIKFNPKLESSLESRKARFATSLGAYKDALRNVPDITQDRILRVLSNILEATVRTNFYEKLPYISFKIRSDAIEIMAKPKPLFEIFVSSPRVEGIHLRAGMVARGGLRWSERREDYRQEILGLMKTQVAKNALIVPTGAKGGFIVKQPPADPKEMPAAVEEAYREFIRALLSVTDNRVNDQIVHPTNLVIYDEADPYFVVAADKGTAKFSDVANEIAEREFNFWLGDAFASGGSNGYDHKLYGITARGAWECVQRHFSDIGIDQTKPFRVVGIGDMAGDVFGNGLLGSDQIKLLAAFNHEHIFIDPDPDPKKSFLERDRIFKLARSKWSDYNPSLISKGGGIFGRLDKEIRITPEMRSSLSIQDPKLEVVNGEQLISIILKADCELLWNGGIGTYVKAQSESHAVVNDGTNDAVRIDAKELRAKVVGEGGNLGLTQLARIEYDQNGGRTNTDAIDNSGGVDLSDHEVNYKLLFLRIVRAGKLSIEERNKILKEMAEEACQMVLRDNYSHALLISLAKARSIRRMDNFKNLIRELSRKGYIDRNLSFLPDDEELGKRANRKLPLTRPELALLVSAVKMWLKDQLRQSNFPADPLLQGYLLSYFPETLRQRFEAEILEHPLAREIIITQIVNNVVDLAGVTFIHRTALNLSVPPLSVLKCYLAASLLLDVEKIRAELRRVEGKIENRAFLDLLQLLNRSVGELTVWFVNHHSTDSTLNDLVEIYKEPLAKISGQIEACMPQSLTREFKARFDDATKAGVTTQSAKQLALSSVVLPLFGILWSARASKRESLEIAPVYFAVIEDLGIQKILDREQLIETSSQWESELLFTSLTDLRRGISKLVTASLHLAPHEVSTVFDSRPETARLKHFVRELRDQVPPVTAVAVIARQIGLCVN